MNVVTALAHTEFRKTLATLAGDEKGTQMERDLAHLALRLYDLNPTHPGAVAMVNEMTMRVFDAA